MRLCIVDDHEIVREGLRVAIPTIGSAELVAEAASGTEAMEAVRRTLPEVVISDFRLPDMAGDELCLRIRDSFPSTAFVFLTTYLSENVVSRAIDAGAAGFVTKSAGLAELRRSLLRIERDGGVPLTEGPSEIVRRLYGTSGETGPRPRLTPQQERVLELTAAGKTYAQIGTRLHISESTVRFHIRRLKDKVGVSSNAELIVEAIRSALIVPERGSPTL